jgi:glutamate-1-semialdehyde 2,1-aminomutase
MDKVTNQRDWDNTDRDYYQRIIEAVIERGIMPDLDPREPWFLCYAHSNADIDETLNIMRDVVKVTRAY